MALTYNDTTFSTENIIFGDVKKYTKPAAFQRIPLSYKYPDGERKLSIKIPESFSWGIQANKNTSSSRIDSYTFPFVMGEEKGTIEMLETICEAIKKHLLTEEVKEALGIWDKDEAIHRMTILYRKKNGVRLL